MSRAQVLAALAVIAALAVVAFLQRRVGDAPLEGPQVVVPEGTLTAVATLAIEREGRDGESCSLALRGDRWILTSRDDAPVESEHLQRLLDAVDGLVGEPRADDAGLLPDFQLAGDGATHLRFADAAGNEQLHLLVGKRGPRVNRSFVRLADDDRAWLAHAGLHSALGIHGHGDRPFDPDFYVDLHLFGVEADEVLEVQAQGLADWTLARVDAAGPWTWDAPGAPDDRGATGKAHTVARSRAAGLVGAAVPAGAGLEHPDGTLTVRTPTATVILRIGATVPPAPDEENPRDERYVSVEGHDLVWRMSSSAVDSLFREIDSADRAQ
jgi:hypothetical protein